MKLYYSQGACALASQIALREAGMTFSLVKTDLKNKTTADGDFKKINPKGYVPALQMDNGEVLTEGAVILQWIADQVPDKKLLPKLGTWERYRANEWLNFIASELHKGFGAFFNSVLNDDAKKAMLEILNRRLSFLDQHLKDHKFILGSEFSLVDAYAFNILRWASYLKIDISSHKNVLGLVERVGQRPASHAAIEAEGLKG